MNTINIIGSIIGLIIGVFLGIRYPLKKLDKKPRILKTIVESDGYKKFIVKQYGHYSIRGGGVGCYWSRALTDEELKFYNIKK